MQPKMVVPNVEKVRELFDDIRKDKKVTRSIIPLFRGYDDLTGRNVFEHIGVNEFSFRVALKFSSGAVEKRDVKIGGLRSGWARTLSGLVECDAKLITPIMDSTFKQIDACGTFIAKEAMGNWRDGNCGAVWFYLSHEVPENWHLRADCVKAAAKAAEGFDFSRIAAPIPAPLAGEGDEDEIMDGSEEDENMDGTEEEKDEDMDGREEEEEDEPIEYAGEKEEKEEEFSGALLWEGEGELKELLRCCLVGLDGAAFRVKFKGFQTGISLEDLQEKIIDYAKKHNIMLSGSHLRNYDGVSIESGRMAISEDMVGDFKQAPDFHFLRENISLVLFSSSTAWTEIEFEAERDRFFRVAESAGKLSFPRWIIAEDSSETESDRGEESTATTSRSTPKAPKKKEKKERKPSLDRQVYRGASPKPELRNRPRDEKLFPFEVCVSSAPVPFVPF